MNVVLSMVRGQATSGSAASLAGSPNRVLLHQIRLHRAGTDFDAGLFILQANWARA